MDSYPFTQNTSVCSQLKRRPRVLTFHEASREALRRRISLLPLPLKLSPAMDPFIFTQNITPEEAHRHQVMTASHFPQALATGDPHSNLYPGGELFPVYSTTAMSVPSPGTMCYPAMFPLPGQSSGCLGFLPNVFPHAPVSSTFPVTHASISTVPAHDVTPDRDDSHDYERNPGLVNEVNAMSIKAVHQYYQCGRKNCKQAFVSLLAAQHHTDRCSKPWISSIIKVKRKRHCCPDITCEKVYTSRQNVRGHVRSWHLNETFVCKTCGKTFKSESAAKRHKKQSLEAASMCVVRPVLPADGLHPGSAQGFLYRPERNRSCVSLTTESKILPLVHLYSFF